MAAAASPEPDPRLEGGMFLAVGSLFLLIFAYATRTADPDMWGHLRYGKYFSEVGYTSNDPFAYTSEGLTWHAHEYFSQIILWQAYHLGGAGGLLLLKVVTALATFAVLAWGLVPRLGDARLWVPALLLVCGIVGRSCLFRPQLFSFLFFAIFVSILYRWLTHRLATAWLFSLPLVLGLWANMHGAFLAGIGAIGMAGLLRLTAVLRLRGRDLKALFVGLAPIAGLLAACGAASVINPMGIDLWHYVLTEMTHDTNRRLIEEWQPLDITRQTWSGLTFVILLLGLFITAVPAIMNESSDHHKPVVPSWAWLLSCVPLVVMAFQSVRHIPIAAIWACPVLAHLARRAESFEGWRLRWNLAWLVYTGVVLVPAGMTAWVVSLDPLPHIMLSGRSVLGEERPFRVVAFMKQQQLRGNVYNPLWWGSYITWELYPDVLVAMDGRNVTLFPSAFVRENLLFYRQPSASATLHAVERWPQTDFLLIPAGSGAAHAVKGDKRWVHLYKDDDCSLYVRDRKRYARWIEQARRQGPYRGRSEEPHYFR